MHAFISYQVCVINAEHILLQDFTCLQFSLKALGAKKRALKWAASTKNSSKKVDYNLDAFFH